MIRALPPDRTGSGEEDRRAKRTMILALGRE